MSLLLILITVVTSLASSITLYLIFSHIMREQVLRDLDNLMEQNSGNLDALFSSINQASLYLCTDKTAADILNTDEPDPVDRAADANFLSSEVVNHVAIPLNGVLNNYTYNFFVAQQLPLSQDFSAAYNFTASGIHSDKGVCQSDWYLRTRELAGAFHAFTMTLDDGQRCVVLTRSVSNPYLIRDTLPDGYLGMMMFSISSAQIARKIDPAKLTEHTRLFLVDGDGSILYSQNSGPEGNVTRYLPKSLLSGYDNKRLANVIYAGKTYITSINDLKYGYHLIAMTPDSDITSRLTPVRSAIVLTGVLSAALGVLLSLLFSRSFTRPIQKLAAAMTSVKSKEYFDIFIEPPSEDEVGVLYDSFNRMMKRINKLVEDLLKSVRLQKEAERKTLQAQINPHFLYNTLDAVNWLALSDGDDTLAEVISSLASIMRFSIRNLDKLVTIGEEVENIRNYVTIQSTCHADNFDITYAVADEILTRSCPALTLQPLVENAILYGVERVGVRGIIRIEGTAEGDTISLSVVNNGPPGTDTDELNAYLEGRQTVLKNSDGLGIRSVNQRVKLHFGDRYGLRYSTTEEGFIKADVTLPLNQKGAK